MTASPVQTATTLAAFVDTLIPGDADFPPASAAGAHGIVANRVRKQLGREGIQRLVTLLDRDEPFAAASSGSRIDAVRRLESDDPELFAFLRFATYFAYYETPSVIAALQALGHDYHDAPQPLGYELPPFDPTKHLPATPRGSYKTTSEIARIDLSTLASLGLPGKEA
ncbi:MAG: hypothetical protein IT336_04715 [Thermomicrobiales bacterium]|nr:hypothetical protein [Thermomicrobiales bacterium]